MYIEFNDRIEKDVFIIFESDDSGESIIGITDKQDQADSICMFFQSAVNKRMFAKEVFYHYLKVDLIRYLEEFLNESSN